MTERVILTEQRENLLTGEYEGSDDAIRKQKWRLKESSKTALEELVKIAESPHVDQQEIFPPHMIESLVGAIMEPEGYNLTVQPPAGEITDEHLAYQYKIQMRLQRLLRDHADRVGEE